MLEAACDGLVMSLQGNILYKLNFPLLENANEYVVHGFTYNVRSAQCKGCSPSCCCHAA